MARPRRSFPADFKAKVVLELLSGAVSQAELCRKRNLKPQLLADWRATVLERLPSIFQDNTQASRQQQRVAELEQLVGRQTLQLEILSMTNLLRA